LFILLIFFYCEPLLVYIVTSENSSWSGRSCTFVRLIDCKSCNARVTWRVTLFTI